jgi:teichuronic acid biosynthesis glycosyltransferase TuaG
MPNELISIIMPAHNAAKFIGDSINSVLKQSYSNWELLIINDGSTDNTLSIAKEYAETDSRIRVITQANQKQGVARNNGIKNSKGTWIGFLDADDLWYPEKLEKQIATSLIFPEVDVIYTDGWIFRDNDLENTSPYISITDRLIEGREMYKLEYSYNYIPILAVIVKRSLIDKTGLQDEQPAIQGCEDWDYWIRMAKAGAHFYGMPDKLFYYRKHGNNMSDNSIAMLLARVTVLIKNFDPEFIDKNDALVIIKSLAFPLINRLIKNERFEDANFILKGMQHIAPSVSYKLIRGLINTFKANAYIPVAVIGKIARM